MGYFVYRGTGQSKQIVAGPFNTQAIADVVARTMSANDQGDENIRTYQSMSNENAGGKLTSQSSFQTPKTVTTAISKGARSSDNDK